MSLYGRPGACYIDLPVDLILQRTDSSRILYVAASACLCVIQAAIRTNYFSVLFVLHCQLFVHLNSDII